MHRVIIIGGDHHNTLAVIRAIGCKKTPFIVLVHSNINDVKKLMIYYSKYVKRNIFIVGTSDETICEWLIDNKNSNDKDIIIPCSDLSAYSLDKNYKLLSKYYYIPGFKNNPGKICKMMNKFEQNKWAISKKILMAKSWLLYKENMLNIPNDIIYPCIVKPSASVYGNKSDIKICTSKKELLSALKIYKESYESVLIQQFIQKDYEIVAMGYISKSGTYGGVQKKIRETIPGGGGSSSLCKFINNQEVISKVNEVVDNLYNEGYIGFYDIELFVCGDNIYLNEINYRHSGVGFAIIDNGINCPYLYYLDCIGKNDSKKIRLKHPSGYSFCDLGEIHLLTKYHDINFFQFIGDFIKSYTHSIFHITDIKVIIIQLYKMLKRKV